LTARHPLCTLEPLEPTASEGHNEPRRRAGMRHRAVGGLLRRAALWVAVLAGLATLVTAPASATGGSPPTDYELAKRFQPYLMFDHAERWRPIDPSVVLAEGNHRACVASGPCRPISSALTLQEADLNQPDSSIALNGSRSLFHPRQYHAPELSCNTALREPIRSALLDCDRGAASRIFFHVFRLPAVFIEYWVYYRFDVTDAELLLGHQSDWEGVVVAPQPPAFATFSWVGFAAHNGPPWRYPRDIMRCDSQFRGSCGAEAGAHMGQRVLVYVAEGSHASYPLPCRRTTILSCGQNAKVGGLFSLPERGFDGTAPWAANNDATTVAPIDGQPWLGWQGTWNAKARLNSAAVRTPPNQPRYLDPARTKPARCDQRWCRPVL
jgi:hypothetical protein